MIPHAFHHSVLLSKEKNATTYPIARHGTTLRELGAGAYTTSAFSPYLLLVYISCRVCWSTYLPIAASLRVRLTCLIWHLPNQ